MKAIKGTCSRWGVALALVAPLAVALQIQAQQPLSADDSEFFESKIRPLLIESCFKCHSSTAEKVKGGLLLDSKEACLKGGTTGPAVVPGNAEKSLMVKAVRYTDPDLRMPPKEKLSDQQIADIEAWVRRGAPDPRSGKQAGILKSDSDREKAKQHWSFRPVKKPEVPESKFRITKWIQNPIDSFIVAKLAEKDMLPSQAADKWTLIRRAYFDLIGLPPSPQEVEAFVNDESPDAFAKVVNQLLNSPQYGERWGRYWLDIARYADTKGGNGNVTPSDQRYLYSYTYRDYVVNAFNEDLPYDQFLLQQIAADQLDLSNNKKALSAMGFLTLGRAGNNIQEVIDDRIDVLTRGTQGLTVYCARCHDHKFDPVPTKDYYALWMRSWTISVPRPRQNTNWMPRRARSTTC
jgi:cytochrome c553